MKYRTPAGSQQQEVCLIFTEKNSNIIVTHLT
jgi:hypothetical protein